MTMAEPLSSGGSRLGDRGKMLYVSKNTFIECRSPSAPTLQRSHSDSDLSIGSARSKGSELSRGVVHSESTHESLGDRFYLLGQRGGVALEGGASDTSNDSRTRLAADPDPEPEPRGRAPSSARPRPSSDAPDPWPEQELDRLVATSAVAADKAELLRPMIASVPFDESAGEYTSVGSLNHPDSCQHCLFWFKSTCKKGISCDYCHFTHEGQKKKFFRASKRTRQLMKAAAAQRQEGNPDDSGNPDDPGLPSEAAVVGQETDHKPVTAGQKRFSMKIAL